MVSYKVLFLVFFSNFVHQGYCVLPVLVSSAVVSGDGSDTCPSQSSIDAQLNATKAQIRQAITNTVNPILDAKYFSPGSCNGTGWTRVALLNMTDPDEVCPSSLSMLTSPVRGCGRPSTSVGCNAVLFNIVQDYSEVCGRILAYQRGTPDAFHPFIIDGQTTIDSAYVDGVSLTHGPAGSRQHIWTFAAAPTEDQNFNRYDLCPCITSSWPYQVPAFIGSNYFCDTGNPFLNAQFTPFYLDDPLWNGEGCSSRSMCCQFNDPPWFQTELPQATRDGVELRLCLDQVDVDEEVIISLIEIYVK